MTAPQYRVHLTPKSTNAKTGPIPVSTTSRATCSKACPLFNNGCYAESGPLALHWRAVTEGARGTNWRAFCGTIAGLEPDTLWRHNQAGDLPGDGMSIDARALALLVSANESAQARGFTYTHYPMTARNRAIVAGANARGFTVNLSANDLTHADELADLGIGPVVSVLPIDTDAKTVRTPAGRTVVVCPATYRDDTSCATCQLCARADRTTIVGFPAHGSSARKADRVARRVIPLAVAA